jgi:Uma2 family endonuclease
MSTVIRSLADFQRRIGGVPADRIRFRPAPGTATVADVDRIRASEGILCELVEGVLLEKPMGALASRMAVYLAGLLNSYIIPRNLGFVLGADGALELLIDLVRIPDISFVRWKRISDGRMPTKPIPRVSPNLAVEVLSPSNTPGEMAAKRRDYFAAGVELVWEIDPERRTVTVYTSVTDAVTLGPTEILDGGSVLPGFRLPLHELFVELDRHG